MNQRSPIAPIALGLILALPGCTGAGSLFGGACSPQTYALDFPTVSCFAASGQITSAAACFASARVQTFASLNPITGFAYPAQIRPLLYLAVSFSSNEFAKSLPALMLTIPFDAAASERQYFLAANEANGSEFAWTSPVLGKLDASGTRVSFPASGSRTTFYANERIELFMFSTGGP